MPRALVLLKVLTALGAGLFTPILAQADDRVQWFVSHFPPGYIRVGKNIGSGHMDLALDQLQVSLSDYQHTTVDGPLPRIMASMRKRDGVCSNGLFKTSERAQFITFSKPYIWIVSNRLVVAEGAMDKVRPYLDAQGAVDVAALLKDPKVRFGYGRSRVYGPAIDAALKSLANDPRGQQVIHSETLMKMIAGQRFDVTFAYPAEATYHLRRLDLSPDLSYLPIVGEARFYPVHVGCSRRPLGQRIIAGVDRIIDAAGVYPDWYRHYEENLDPGTVKELRAFVPTAQK